MDQGKDQLNTPAHPGSQQARANIDLTRQAMDRTIDAIEGKLTPGQLLLEGLNLLKSGGASGANKLVELAREHPVPAAVIGVGVGMMIRDASHKKAETGRAPSAGYAPGYGYGEPMGGYGASRASGYGAPRGMSDYAYGDGPGAASRVTQAASTAKEKVSEVTHSARETVTHSVHDAKDTVAEAAHTAKETVAEAAHSAKETVGDVAHTAREKVTGAVETARERASAVAGSARETARETASSMQEQAARLRERAHVQVRDARIGFWQKLDQDPLIVGAAAVAVGLVAGLLLPSTHCEDEALGTTRDELLGRARETGRDVLEKGKQVAQTAVQTLKTEAEQQGFTPQDIVEKVRTIGRDVVEQAKTEAQREGLVAEPSSGSTGEGA
jgi:vacuolar-type H+-ATPase subunit H